MRLLEEKGKLNTRSRILIHNCLEMLYADPWKLVKNLRIPSYISKPFRMYDFAPGPNLVSLYMRKILFSFLSVYLYIHRSQSPAAGEVQAGSEGRLSSMKITTGIA
jgi:hypothetical protein